ncbi:MAG: LysM peptidoglycan-binding domain-containing protein [Caldilineaceae bacterium SB0675_bin_29]|uniref:LysM peptidoglycan-binding domain-containing protein n=1 Tax=Caldilineaceae bacterium SB0675_bin_29 TaxID=2605266 RepID=A0A6B1FVX9_9CHLR|nr:LysM peptidoglycan-binding domain-containing protein [Caldilineaceae bacterium SB0675_bin_29]
MNRRLLVFFILVNALVSLTIAVTVVWIAEQRRPNPEELVVPATPEPAVVLIATPTSGDAQTSPESGSSPPATPTEVAAPPEPGETEIYTVKAGDSLSAIAARYGVSLNRLLEINDLADPNLVYVGQRLTIPVSQQQGAAVGLPQQGLQLRIENAGELAAESVQVVNDSDGAVDLQGWTLSRDGGPIYTFSNILLFPGSGIRLNTGSGEDNSINRFWGRDAAAWEIGSTVILRNPNGELIAQRTVAGGESP